ncbi:MAG: hypothetical protein ABIE75_03145 [Candidatus Omnitrophota bacterium]
MIKKPNLGIHFGIIDNSKSFDQSCAYIQKNPNQNYYTTGNNTPFVAKVSVCAKGNHKGENVIIFKTKTNKNKASEKARAYACCWGHKTNCNKTHIDCFTKAI